MSEAQKRRAPFPLAHRIKLAESVAKTHAQNPGFNLTHCGSPTNLEFALDLLLQDAGLEYESQKRFGRYVVDAYVPSRGLAFEADGAYWHSDKAREARRDAYLVGRGIIAVVHLNEHDLAAWMEV